MKAVDLGTEVTHGDGRAWSEKRPEAVGNVCQWLGSKENALAQWWWV